MQRKRELVENLTAVRTFTIEDEGMQALVDSIGKRGLRKPLLVYDSKVVDGAKRICALRILGLEAADIEVAEDMFEVIEALGALSKEQLPTIDRIADMLTVLSPYAIRRDNRPGGRERWYKLHPELTPITQWGRQMTSYATGYVLSESALMRMAYLITRAAEGDELSAKMLAGVRSGEMTPHQGRLTVGNAQPRFIGNTKSAADQRKVLINGADNLTAAVQAFTTLGTPLRVPSREIDDAVGRLQQARFAIYALIRELKKEKSRKENDSA